MEALEVLKNAAPFELPESYLRFLAFSDGGEGPLPDMPLNICLYPSEETAQIAADRIFEEFFPHLFVIGGNGGGEAIAFDLRGTLPPGVVYFDMIGGSPLPLAPSFDALIDIIGRSE